MCIFKRQRQHLFFVLGLLMACSAWGVSPEPASQEEQTSFDEVITQELYLGDGEPDFSVNGMQPDNTVVAFFWNVELRYVADEQMNEIIQALTDMTTQSAMQLQQARYADFYGAPDEWTLLQLLYAYFVPETPVSLAHFYEDIEKPESRQIVRQTLDDIQAYINGNGQADQPAQPVIGW